ncbi:unnamed protein product, partial [marine sediment metagenome]
PGCMLFIADKLRLSSGLTSSLATPIEICID